MHGNSRNLIVGLAVVGVLALAGCDNLENAEQRVESEARQVEQTLHDDVVAAYDRTSSFIGEIEGDVSDAARTAYDEAASDFAALESRIDGAADKVGDEAVREYREIQHEVHHLIRRADDFLHTSGSELADAEHSAWAELKEGYHGVTHFIDHVVDRLH